MAAKRKVIAVPYNVNPKWMGGVIYVLNTIKVLNWLADNQKPIIKLYYRKELRRFVEEINYPYLQKIPFDFPYINQGYLSSWLCGKNMFIHEIIEDAKPDAVFPVMDHPITFKKYPNVKLVSWYADLQHKHYPEFFSKRKLIERDLRVTQMLSNSNNLVISSKSVLKDFQQFYKTENLNFHVYHFASVIDSFDFSKWESLRVEKGLPQNYFMVCNQFLKHKNHKIILEALLHLKKKGKSPVVAFTGDNIGILSSQNLKVLHQIIKKHNLEKQIVFLGILSRHQQLTLMRYCKAVIQPSLFEGWSTTIEDAISIQTPVIASNIEVNKEQLGDWAPFFDPHNPEELAKIIENQPDRTNFDEIIYEPYEQRIKRAAQAFMSIFENKAMSGGEVFIENNLNRIKLIQINTVVNSASTGKIAEQIGELLIKAGHESYIAYGRGNRPSKSKLIKIGSDKDVYNHALSTLFFDKHGLASKDATKDLIKKIDEIQPDVIGLHNIHGYYLNYQVLFEYIKTKEIPVIWTFHDCWPFTGHCSYFDSVGCEKWKTHCNKCPIIKNYPKALTDRSYQNFEDKQEAFTGIKKMQIITPSNWLRNHVKQSFLKDYPVTVIHNGIDLNIFKPLNKTFSPKEKIVLGVASTWDKRKGLHDFIEIRKKIASDIKIVLIGLSFTQIQTLPKGIKGIQRTENVDELVKWYNRATVFVNPTYIDNFPTTNLEALACGTPIITYNTGGCPEAVCEQTGNVIPKGDINALARAISDINKDNTIIDLCRNRALKHFNAEDRYKDYLDLYEKIKK
jgi:glycosyltransferase involved in cell wall biosynthesis